MLFENYTPNYIEPDYVDHVEDAPKHYTPTEIVISELYSTLVKKNDYLYEITFNKDFDYALANSYFSTHNVKRYPRKPANCSSVRKGNYYGRNLDWNYDDEVTFVMKTNKTTNRLASLGVGGYCPRITKEIMENDPSSISVIDWKTLPFRIVDGINEMGVFINSNVVPETDMGITKGTNLGIKPELCVLALVRYVLDHFGTAEYAVNYIKNNLSIYTMREPYPIESHFMIGDSDKTFVIEFHNNQLVSKEYNQTDNYAIMTNFYQNIDNLITNNEIDYDLATPHGQGHERWDLIVNKYNNLTSLDSMKSLMREDLKYTNSYKETTNPFWLTELTGTTKEFGDLTVQDAIDDPTKFDDAKAKAISDYTSRTRDGKTWQTCHTSVYDLENKKLYLTNQEDSTTEYEYQLVVE